MQNLVLQGCDCLLIYMWQLFVVGSFVSNKFACNLFIFYFCYQFYSGCMYVSAVAKMVATPIKFTFTQLLVLCGRVLDRFAYCYVARWYLCESNNKFSSTLVRGPTIIGVNTAGTCSQTYDNARCKWCNLHPVATGRRHIRQFKIAASSANIFAAWPLVCSECTRRDLAVFVNKE